jgi:hypothetical protein
VTPRGFGNPEARRRLPIMTDKTPPDSQVQPAHEPPMRRTDGMPGGRAALPEGNLSKPFFGAQGDEQRDPPPGSPAPVMPAPVVEGELPPARPNRAAKT